MSADNELHLAIRAALLAAPSLAGAINGVFEGTPVKASPPYAELGEMLATDWGTKDSAGRELRTSLIIRDRAERPLRLHALAVAAEDAIAALAPALSGWRIISIALIRSRIVRDGPGQWVALIEHRFRLLAEV